MTAEGDRLRANAPKGILTADLRSQIADRKAEIIAALNSAKTFSPPPIFRRAANDPAPLSFAQERLWFLEQLEPGSGVYGISRASRLIGDLNVPALDASLNEIVRRHEVLRSAFRETDGRPLQVTLPARQLALSLIDLRGPPAPDDDEVLRWIQEEAARPLDLRGGLLLRGSLLRVGDDKHILILTTHHIVSDAWSMGILTRELWSLYEAYAAGKRTRLKDLPIQYADFASWQREWLQGEILESQLSYWRKQLHDIPILNLPTDRTRPGRQSFCGAGQSITLSQSLTTAVHELSQRQIVTPFMSLLAAFLVLLYRYNGQDDIVVGSPIANRSRTELESLIGFFVNTLVLRSNLSGNPTFRELLARVREVCLGAYAHQDLPFEKLVQELQPERDRSRNPLFQVMFVLQNATRPITEVPGLRVEPIELGANRSPFDLSLFLRERDGRFIGYFEYSTDLFERETIARMAGHFERLLEGIVADPDQPISTLPILTEPERHQILVEWNNTEAEYPKDKCIHKLFEAQVERTPEAIALEFEGEEITYRELNRRANQLAHYLIRLGIGPERLVGICVERSIEMVIGLMGILKAGGAYMPLDPRYPNERLRFMLEDSDVSVLLTQEKLVEDRGWRMETGNPQSSIFDPRLQAVFLDRDLPKIERESSENSSSKIHSDNLAYVIYTSGSTGTPKGVLIEHRNTVALLHWAKEVFTANEVAGVMASTSICFDLSVFELFVPLSWGGKINLVENSVSLRETDAKGMTLVNTVPSAIAALLAAGALPDSVRVVNLAGESLSPELVNQLYQTGSVEKVYDLYGPTETTTYSTFTLRTRNGPATIGRPISNTRVYILDGNLQPVPIGVQGELYIGGGGVARGYLNRSELTTESFRESPFNGERLYGTGDLARYLSDGNIEFLGRVDNQVKIRGYRIELDEIEAVLNQHPAVNDSVIVTLARESLAEKNLIGYIVPKHQPAASVVELRNYLKEKLPEYMIPSAFVMLNSLPLMSNGKIDRKVLPPPDDIRPELEAVSVEPRTQVEELMAEIWREVLKVETIGFDDNFFELGGHSLLAVEIISRVREVFDKEAPLVALFESPTVAGFAATIEKTISGRSHDLPPIVRVRDGPLPLSVNQEHLWRLDQMIPGTHFFNIPYVYRLSGDLNVAALEKTLEEIIRRHEALRTVFAEIDGRPVQVVKEAAEVQLPYIDLRGESATEVSQKAAGFILEEREGPFDLAAGPLLRIKLLRLTDTDYFLLVTMHHVISDHRSMQIFHHELASFYEACLHHRQSPLPESKVQFADYACWEHRMLNEGQLDDQLAYWKKQLRSPLPSFNFRKTRKLKRPLDFNIVSRPFEFKENLFTSFRAAARKENCTPFISLLTAINILLHMLTRHELVPIGTLVANRGRRETENVIGLFVNTVILRTTVSPDMTIRDLLRQVRSLVLLAHTNQELPFEYLARELRSEKKRRKRDPICQVLLIYHYSFFEPRNIAGIQFAPLDIPESRPSYNVAFTTCDMILNVKESSTKLTGHVNYRIDRCDRPITANMTRWLTNVAEAMVISSNQRRISDIIEDVKGGYS